MEIDLEPKSFSWHNRIHLRIIAWAKHSVPNLSVSSTYCKLISVLVSSHNLSTLIRSLSDIRQSFDEVC